MSARPLHLIRGLGLAAAGLGAAGAQAYLVSIDSGPTLLYLQVGAGNMSGNFNSGGVPGRNATQNWVSVTVPAAAVGSGVAQSMSTDSTVTNSPFDGYAFCNSPATTGQVYIGGFFRAPGNGNGGGATLSVNTSAPLSSGSATIPFNRIAWTSSGNGDGTPTIPSGAFTTGSQTLRTISRNSWFESCMAFRYLNTEFVPAGTFTGTATYTLTAQ